MAIEWCLKALRAVAGTGHTHGAGAAFEVAVGGGAGAATARSPGRLCSNPPVRR